jgi:hypothetical protein
MGDRDKKSLFADRNMAVDLMYVKGIVKTCCVAENQGWPANAMQNVGHRSWGFPKYLKKILAETFASSRVRQ